MTTALLSRTGWFPFLSNCSEGGNRYLVLLILDASLCLIVAFFSKATKRKTLEEDKKHHDTLMGSISVAASFKGFLKQVSFS